MTAEWASMRPVDSGDNGRNGNCEENSIHLKQIKKADVKCAVMNTSQITAQAILSLDEHYETPRKVFLAEIINAVSVVFNVSKSDILSSRRIKNVCEARQVYFWVARKFTTQSFPEIGRRCGDKDHSTVMHGARKIDIFFPEFREKIASVLKLLGINSEVTR